MSLAYFWRNALEHALITPTDPTVTSESVEVKQGFPQHLLSSSLDTEVLKINVGRHHFISGFVSCKVCLYVSKNTLGMQCRNMLAILLLLFEPKDFGFQKGKSRNAYRRICIFCISTFTFFSRN